MEDHKTDPSPIRTDTRTEIEPDKPPPTVPVGGPKGPDRPELPLIHPRPLQPASPIRGR